MPESEKLAPDPFSKSQRKRDMLALQEIGLKLMTLSASQLDKLSLPDSLRESIDHGKTLKAHEAKRRHAQYIGKLMRNVDIEALKKALKKISR